MRYLFKILFLFFLTVNIYSQNINISGVATDYANDTLILSTIDDYISNTKIEIGKIILNDTGYFSTEIDVEKTILAEVDLGKYKGLIFFEPDRNYQIKLPKKEKKQIEDILNPYFKQTELYLGILNSDKDELNFLVKKFDYFYDHYIEDNFSIIYRQGYNSEIDTFITKLSKYFEFAENKYFDDYIKYKFANLSMFAVERTNNIYVIGKYFSNQRLLYNNVAYMEMFNQVFQNYLSYYANTKEGENIFSDIAKAKSIYHLKKSLDKNVALANDTLKELVILKGLNDAFGPQNTTNLLRFPRQQLLQTLDSMIILTKIPEHKHIAENIKRKVTAKKLKISDDAPNFKLYNDKGELIDIKSLKGKYVYLSFYSSWNIACLQEIALLKNIYKKHKDKLEIVTVFCDGTLQNMKDDVEENTYEWIFLFLNDNNKILKEYNVSVYPTYLLLDPYSRIVMMPAPSPNADFEQEFLRILKSRN